MTLNTFRQPLGWAWVFVVFWLFHSLYALYAGDETALIITLTGLLAALLIVSAIQSRRRKNLYPGRHATGEKS